MNSITKRWVRGSLLFTIAVLVVAEALFLYFTITSYYDRAQQAAQGQIDTVLAQLAPSASAATSAENKAIALRSTVEQYEEKARFELMLVDASGAIVSSSSGMLPAAQEVTPDIIGALNPSSGYSNVLMGRNQNGEKVLAVTALTPFSSENIVAVRVVTSLSGVDSAVFNIIVLSLVIIFAIIFASVISGIYFIRSIVLPLQKVEATATHIAHGDLDIRIENNANDEIGSLCRTINHMAEELGKSEKMKNDFISSVSHELRTPLTSIKGWIETVGQISDPSDPYYRRGVEIIAGEADRLYDMVEELLDFSRMQQGLTLVPELLDLAAEVEEAVLLEAQRAQSLALQIEYEAPELPVPVMADKNRIRQVLINVLDNAMKYSNSGGIIAVEILQDTMNAFIVVSDEGTGISQEDLEHVKVRFYKGEGAVRGSGIGLAVVDEIMQAHDGALEISSEAGKGTEVTLRLPLHKKEPAAKQRGNAPREGDLNGGTLQV